MPWLAALVLAIIVLHILVAVHGRWSGAARWARIFPHMSAAVQLGWHARYGNIFQLARTNRVLVPAVATLAGILANCDEVPLQEMAEQEQQAITGQPISGGGGG